MTSFFGDIAVEKVFAQAGATVVGMGGGFPSLARRRPRDCVEGLRRAVRNLR
jgi:hypothetical protein